MIYLRAAMIALVVALFPAGFIAGCMDEKARFDAWKDLQGAVGKAQDDRTTARVANDKLTKQEVDRDHKKRLSRLRADHELDLARMRADTDRSLLPAVPDTPGRGDIVRPATVCFDRDKFDAGVRGSLQRFAERTAGIVERGEIGNAGFAACATWALKEWQAK